MARTVSSPPVSKVRPSAHHARLKGQSKLKSSTAIDVFLKNGRVLTGRKTGTAQLPLSLSSKAAKFRGQVNAMVNPRKSRQPRRQSLREAQDEDPGRELDVTSKVSRNWSVYAADEDENDGADESLDDDESDDDDGDWIDGSTLIAPYQEKDSETEEDRTVSLVEYLQVPMQEKSQAIKQELCDILMDTIGEIRETHQKLERGADVDRGKGIITFNDACHKRHVDTSHACAELKDSMADNQAKLKKLFVELKQAYSRRDQLWVDFKLRIEEITKVQATALDQLDDSVERTIATLEKKGKALFKDDAGRDKEKLLRGVLGKL